MTCSTRPPLHICTHTHTHTFNLSTREAETGRSLWVLGQLGLQELVPGKGSKATEKNPVSKNKNKNKKPTPQKEAQRLNGKNEKPNPLLFFSNSTAITMRSSVSVKGRTNTQNKYTHTYKCTDVSRLWQHECITHSQNAAALSAALVLKVGQPLKAHRTWETLPLPKVSDKIQSLTSELPFSKSLEHTLLFYIAYTAQISKCDHGTKSIL